jgi:malate dehydrogenase (oxaloacetate-decarboxylating)(NADP+)
LKQGLAFTREERQILGIHGLLAPAIKSEEDQIKHAHILLERCANDLDRYIYLMGLQDRNERLFYRVLASDISNMMPLVYTPVSYS